MDSARYMQVLSRARIFRNCSENDISSLLSAFHARTMKYVRGSYILHAGDRTSRIFLMLSGHALIIQEDWWGNRNIISQICPSNIFGESFACVKDSVLTVSVTADADTEVVIFNMDDMLRPSGIAAQKQMLNNFIEDLSMKNIMFSEKLRHLGGRSTRAKLLSYLSAEAQRQKSNEFDIPFSRQELADYLFIERSGLSVELSKMKAEGLISTEKNHFVLHHAG